MNVSGTLSLRIILRGNLTLKKALKAKSMFPGLGQIPETSIKIVVQKATKITL